MWRNTCGCFATSVFLCIIAERLTWRMLPASVSDAELDTRSSQCTRKLLLIGGHMTATNISTPSHPSAAGKFLARRLIAPPERFRHKVFVLVRVRQYPMHQERRQLALLRSR